MVSPEELVKIMHKTIASQALFSLAEEYLNRIRFPSSIQRITIVQKKELFEKAIASALKAASIDPDPLNTYKAGTVLERAGKIDDAKAYYPVILGLLIRSFEKRE